MRLALLADVHLGTAQTQFPNQDYIFASNLLRLAVPMVRALAPDEVVLVGDLVNMGTAEEYQIAREILDEINAPITAVPGNHELIRGNLDDFRRHAPGGLVDQIKLPDDGPTIAWLNSGVEGLSMWHWHGTVGDEGLNLLDRATAERPDQPLIVFCHHPPEGTVRVPRHPMMGLTNSEPVMPRLMRHPAPVVMFSGHTHVADVYRRRNVTVIACPSMCFWPHAFLMAELRDGLLDITMHRVIDSPDDSPDPYIRAAGYLAEREPWVRHITMRLESGRI